MTRSFRLALAFPVTIAQDGCGFRTDSRGNTPIARTASGLPFSPAYPGAELPARHETAISNLVLEDDEHTLEGIVELLREAGHNVTGATRSMRPSACWPSVPDDLLITDVRLRAFNDWDIVMRSRVDYPEMAVIIISGYDEPLMEIEASRYHATFVAKPIKAGEFLKTVSDMLAAVRRQRRWPRKRVVGGFRVTAAGRTAAVVDVSYGGLPAP